MIDSQVPETLIGALTELEEEYTKAMKDPEFKVPPVLPYPLEFATSQNIGNQAFQETFVCRRNLQQF